MAPTTPTPTASGAFQTERQVTLIFWHSWPSPEQHILASLIDRYNQSHPNTQIVPQAMPLASFTDELRIAAVVGSGPHLMLLQSHMIGELAQEGLLLPLDDTLVSVVGVEMLLPAALEGARVADSITGTHLYGLPLSFDTLALYYRKDKLSMPPADTDMLLEYAHNLTNTSVQPPVWGFAYTLSLDKTIGYLYAFGGRVLDEQGNIVLADDGRAGTERWLQWLLELRQDDRILAVNDSIAVDSALKAQEALMTIDWAHAFAGYHLLWGDNLGVASLPHVSSTGQAPAPYVQSDVLSINARVDDATEQQAALDFMRYLLSAEAQRALLDVGRQPALLSLQLAGETPELEAARTFRRQAEHGSPMPHSHAAHDVVREELKRMQLAVLRGLATPAEAVTFTDAVLRERLHDQADS
jgi:maltose-binding protein MalE